MKLFSFITTCLIGMTAFAITSPFDKAAQRCVKNQMIAQFPIYSRVNIQDFQIAAYDDGNFDYMIYLQDPKTGASNSRSFISVRNADYANAQLIFSENAAPSKINLTACY